MALFVRFVLLYTALCSVVKAELILKRPPGFTLGNGSAGAGVQLECYIDLTCPDSKSAYPRLTKVVEHYETDEVCVRVVLFPLPYHQHAFATAEAAFTITTALGDKSFTDWLEVMYANQDMFSNKATKDLSPAKLKSLAQQTFPSLTDAQWDSQMTGYGGTDVDVYARESWKYTCTRGKSGTPMYTLNGVPLEAGNKPVLEIGAGAQAWKNARLSGSPRVQPDREVMHFVRAGERATIAQVCEGKSFGARACEYVSGRAMCCHANEACIPREGCVRLQ